MSSKKSRFKYLYRVGLVAVVGIGAAYYWRHSIIGVIRQEKLYDGRYTNYWRESILGWRALRYGSLVGYAKPIGFRLSKQRSRTICDMVPFLRAYFLDDDRPKILDEGDPEALAVLAEMLEESDAETKLLALYAIMRIGNRAEPILGKLIGCTNHSNRDVRLASMTAIGKVAKTNDLAMEVLTEKVFDDDPEISAWAMNEISQAKYYRIEK